MVPYMRHTTDPRASKWTQCFLESRDKGFRSPSVLIAGAKHGSSITSIGCGAFPSGTPSSKTKDTVHGWLWTATTLLYQAAWRNHQKVH